MKLLVITQKVDAQDENLGFFHRWLEEMARHTSEMVVIAHSVGKTALPPHVHVHTLGKGDTLWQKCKKLWKYWELFSHHYAQSDAVFFHMIPEFVVAASPFLIALPKPSALWYVHKSVTRTLRIAERCVDWIITASDLSFRLPSKKILYTGHAIDTDFFTLKPHSQGSGAGLHLLTVGRISPVKDLETLIRACVVLKGTWTRSWSLSIVGGPLMPRDHEYLASLKRLVTEKGLQQYVFFHGPRPYTETPGLYRDHDIFVSLSTTGSLDKSVMEAMASGLTVITANEAFQSMLPQSYYLEKRIPEFLAARITTLADENRPNLVLRKIVEENHSLKKTVGKILEVLKMKV